MFYTYFILLKKFIYMYDQNFRQTINFIEKKGTIVLYKCYPVFLFVSSRYLSKVMWFWIRLEHSLFELDLRRPYTHRRPPSIDLVPHSYSQPKNKTP